MRGGGVVEIAAGIDVVGERQRLPPAIGDLEGRGAALECLPGAESRHGAHRAGERALRRAAGGGHDVFVADAVEHQVGDARPGGGHGHPGHMVELAVGGAAQAAAAAGGGQRDVAAVLAHMLHVAVEMPGEDRVVAAAEHLF